MFDDRRERQRRIEGLRARVPLVAGCTNRQLAEIDNLGATIDVRAGDTLTSEGSAGHELFVVLRGSAVAWHGDVAVGTITAGSVAGEMALLDGTVRSATVVASTPMELLVLDARELHHLLGVAPQIEPALRRVAAERRAALELAVAR